MARRFFEGKKTNLHELPYIYEHMIAFHYGWSLTEIRDMDIQDFNIHVRLCSVRDSIEKDFQAKIVGAGPTKGRGKFSQGKGNPTGTTTEFNI